MSLYSLVLFAHIVGVLGMFIGMGLQWMALFSLRHTQSMAQVRAWGRVVAIAGRLGPIAGALVIGAGIYLMVAAWRLTTAWIVVALVAIVVMMLFGMGIAARRSKAIGRLAAEQQPSDTISGELRRRIDDPALWVATQVAGAVALGIVFLMTVKPNLLASLLALAVSLVAGGVVGMLSARRPLVSADASAASREMAESHRGA
jgi:hypothetical protein